MFPWCSTREDLSIDVSIKADNFEATNVTFLSKNLASNVQSSCIDNSKWPKSELWHYFIKATKWGAQMVHMSSAHNAG